jgi:hypothetical protein
VKFPASGWMVEQEDVMPAGPDRRAAEMLKLRQAGRTLSEIGDLYGVTGARVLQILQRAGSDNGTRVRRRVQAEDLPAAAESFADAYRGVIEALVVSGVTRSEVVERFRLFMPETDLAVIAQGITASGAIFDADDRAFSFSPAVIAGAVWYVLAVSLNLDCDQLAAIKEADIREAREVGELLHAAGLDASAVAQVLCRAACARAYARIHPEASLTRQGYDRLRLQIIDQLGFQSAKGTAWWPPTGLTVMKRLGNGYWADALSAIGLTASSKGRARGLVLFDPQDYQDAVTEYLQHATATSRAPTRAGYQEWVDGEQRSGRHRPSFAALRLRYGTWTAAKRAAAPWIAHRPQPRRAARAGTLSIRALHDTQQEVNRFLAELSLARPAASSALVERFIKSYVQEFEYKRREWLRSMILSDDSVVARRLADPSTPGRIRDRLSRTPPDLSAVLSDMYLDKTGGGDPRRTDGWLRPDAQAELDAISDKAVFLYGGLKQARNYLTHNSGESRVSLSTMIRHLSTDDPRFELKQPITRRVVIDWLRAKDAQRLRLLSSGIADLWRGMVVAENILAEPQEPAAEGSHEILPALDPPDSR